MADSTLTTPLGRLLRQIRGGSPLGSPGALATPPSATGRPARSGFRPVPRPQPGKPRPVPRPVPTTDTFFGSGRFASAADAAARRQAAQRQAAGILGVPAGSQAIASILDRLNKRPRPTSPIRHPGARGPVSSRR